MKSPNLENFPESFLGAKHCTEYSTLIRALQISSCVSRSARGADGSCFAVGTQQGALD